MNSLNSHGFRLLVTLLVLFTLSPASMPSLSKAQSSAQERRYEVQTFRNMPVAVHEMRNLQKGEDWFRDLEIVVKNISDKPIYFISFTMKFPDIPPPLGSPENSITGFSLIYGRPELGLLWNLAGSEDKPIKPGDTYVFTIPEGYVTGLAFMEMTMSLTPEQTKNLIIQFNAISFGDGTGYTGGGIGGLRDYRGKIPPVIGKGDSPAKTRQAQLLEIMRETIDDLIVAV